MIFGDIRSFTIEGHHRQKWLNHHITGMLAAYIATVSAFSVVNMEFIPVVVRWLWPTVLGVPLVIMMIRRYTKKPVVKSVV